MIEFIKNEELRTLANQFDHHNKEEALKWIIENQLVHKVLNVKPIGPKVIPKEEKDKIECTIIDVPFFSEPLQYIIPKEQFLYKCIASNCIDGCNCLNNYIDRIKECDDMVIVFFDLWLCSIVVYQKVLID